MPALNPRYLSGLERDLMRWIDDDDVEQTHPYRQIVAGLVEQGWLTLGADGELSWSEAAQALRDELLPPPAL